MFFRNGGRLIRDGNGLFCNDDGLVRDGDGLFRDCRGLFCGWDKGRKCGGQKQRRTSVADGIWAG